MNAKQRKFINYFNECANATEAARRAGYTHPRVQGARLISNPKITPHIEQHLQQFEKESIAKQEEVLKFLTGTMRGMVEVEELVTLGIGKGYSKPEIVKRPPNGQERMKAAELLGKRYALFTDKKDVAISGVVEFVEDVPEDDTETD